MTYEEQLKDPRWLHKRGRIMQRDWNMCQKCGRENHLNVHHKKYLDGRMAWDYPDALLITLCNNCHKEEHGLSLGEDTIPFLFQKIGNDVRAWIGLKINEINNNG